MILKYTENEIRNTVLEIISSTNSKNLCLYGPMGAGKTTLVKALVKGLGGGGNSSSPTFGLVNEYHYPNGEVLGHHFDFYRLRDETEALDMGLEDYLAQGVWIFMEWPEKIPSLLPKPRTELHIKILDDTQREISMIHIP